MFKKNLFSKILVCSMTIFVAGCFSMSLLWAANTANLNVSVELKDATIDVEAEEELSFGTLVPESNKKAKVVLDASAGPATQITVTKGKVAVVDEAQSGLLTVESDIDAELKIEYEVKGKNASAPNTLDNSSDAEVLTLKGGDIEDYSTKTLTVQAGQEAEIHVGGLLEIPETATNHTYEGIITVTAKY